MDAVDAEMRAFVPVVLSVSCTSSYDSYKRSVRIAEDVAWSMDMENWATLNFSLESGSLPGLHIARQQIIGHYQILWFR